MYILFDILYLCHLCYILYVFGLLHLLHNMYVFRKVMDLMKFLVQRLLHHMVEQEEPAELLLRVPGQEEEVSEKRPFSLRAASCLIYSDYKTSKISRRPSPPLERGSRFSQEKLNRNCDWV